MVTHRQCIFFQLIAAHYEHSSIVMIINRNMSEWALILKVPTVTAAILD
ncbi:ATP-binding protein [Sutterella wadsworthensis]